jgi:hypothetical protein
MKQSFYSHELHSCFNLDAMDLAKVADLIVCASGRGTDVLKNCVSGNVEKIFWRHSISRRRCCNSQESWTLLRDKQTRNEKEGQIVLRIELTHLKMAELENSAQMLGRC